LPSEGSARLFVAVEPPSAAAADLAAQVRRLRVGQADAPGHSTRLTRRENWHITVVFLGDVPRVKVARAETVVREVAAQASPITLCVAGGGRFGGRRDPILWAGIGGDVERLRHLARTLQRALRRARLPRDERPPRPHLTISRPGVRVSPEDVAADVATLDTYVGPEWTTTEIVLMRSDIVVSPTGPMPVYTTLVTAPLGQSGD
jgi:2'-5' RNA ligase